MFRDYEPLPTVLEPQEPREGNDGTHRQGREEGDRRGGQPDTRIPAAPTKLAPSPGNQKQFRFFTLKDLENLEPPNWLVEPPSPSDSQVMLFGAPGDGKTFAAL